MMPRRLFLPVAIGGLAAGLLAHVRLVHPSNGKPLYWSDPTGIELVIHDAGSDDVPDASDDAALRLAIAEWNASSGTTARLVEDADPASRARTDWGSSSLHLVYFDESDTSGYFPGASGIVALTPVWFFAGGSISDADVLFNGQDHRFTTAQMPGHFDIQDVAAHELGHLLGLDHSPWAGATMYPYVDPAVIAQRSLSADEVHGLREAYPAASFGQITGTIERLADGSRVIGAHVVARDSAGRTAASVLTNGSGNFTLRGLDPDTYTVYAVPLGDGSGGGSDAPVDESNLSSWFTIQTNFEPAFYPTTAQITGTGSVALGTLDVGADVALNLGVETDRFPVRCPAGATTTVVLHGAGLFAGGAIGASDPDVLLGIPNWFGSQVSFQVTVPPGEAPGHFDLAVTNVQGEISVLPAAIEITPASPTLSLVSPGSGASAGGTLVALTGTGFNAGARVVIGDQIYEDGVGGTAVLSSTSIQLTTLPTLGGTHDVVVIDPTGVEGRAVDAFQALSAPSIASVFPASADAAGGTVVVITGQDFQAGALVRIAGLDQGAVTVDSASRLTFTTQAGVAGLQTLELENPDGGDATDSFTYVAQPDPQVTSVAPASGRKSGGQTITISGSNFSLDAQVLFEVDPDTGSGGTLASSVTWIDVATLSVVTPAFATSGAKSVCVLDGATGQASVIPAAYLVGSDGGGGGGCRVVPLDEPERPSAALAGAWWIALVLALLALRGRRAAQGLTPGG